MLSANMPVHIDRAQTCLEEGSCDRLSIGFEAALIPYSDIGASLFFDALCIAIDVWHVCLRGFANVD